MKIKTWAFVFNDLEIKWNKIEKLKFSSENQTPY
jgi:hypothetical protein